jgi:hypothetical protein
VKTIHEKYLSIGFIAALFLGLSGCGAASDQPELGQVKGTVTLDGKPLSGMAVVFQPDNGRPAHGRTDAEGKYELTYIRDVKGTKIGHNRVEIGPSEGEEEEEEDSIEMEGDEATPAAQQPAASGKPKIPARYNTRSELEADVKPGENTIDFQLKS